MHYKSLVTRMYSVADESIRVVIEDSESFETFKSRLFDVLRITDYRANVQQRRLFEDTELTNSLDYTELKAAKHAAEISFPLEGIPSQLNLGPTTAFEFSKNLPSGEVLQIFLHEVESYEDLSSAIKEIWDVIDSRLKRTNQRELDFMEYLKKLPYEVKLKVCRIMEILYGRNSLENVLQTLKKEDFEETTERIRDEIVKEKENSNNAP